MKRSRRNYLRPRKPLFPFLRKPAGQLTVILLVALAVYLIAVGGVNKKLPAAVSVDQALQMYQNGALVLDVSWPAEWDEYHIPNALLIPLDQLYNRLNEIPKDKTILVVSRSETSAQQARELLTSAGLQAVSLSGSLSAWYEKGYPIEGAPPQ
ncbi:MAG: rhodanese-like domain-containing protein [Anaerolineales bacterium]|nr:rhodanese-like domain-containing protein [Anaerolineales bacterium]